MKKFKKLMAVSLAAALLVTSYTAIAERDKKSTGKPFPRQKFELNEKQKAEMREKAVSQAKERLLKQLEEGKITQEEYDEKSAKIESGEFDFGGRPHGGMGRGRGGMGHGRGGFRPPMKENETPNDAQYRDSDKRPCHEELTDEEKAQMRVQMQENAKERLLKQLEEGKITQEEYDEKSAKIESGEFDFGARPHGGMGRGRGNGHGHGRIKSDKPA